ncbi:DUF4223 family protein [Vibrio alginolyticus]|uniref:DUF4223 family protein n=1 Tax=Vibrio alginolyticus TaxID=663 RepID=UPI0009C13962|nr:DUF4223 family protein [Vibrio alginolyticus]MBY7710412.1 DUF4223 family protein [Vibrio alginolyticus]MCQ9091278.1 DUF4223 family protein [Vibrio alginolyticus]
MKNLTPKLAFIAVVLSILSGCTGTTYNQAKDCSEDYLLHPAISVPSIIGACDSVSK